jgi:hypothetical protein
LSQAVSGHAAEIELPCRLADMLQPDAQVIVGGIQFHNFEMFDEVGGFFADKITVEGSADQAGAHISFIPDAGALAVSGEAVKEFRLGYRISVKRSEDVVRELGVGIDANGSGFGVAGSGATFISIVPALAGDVGQLTTYAIPGGDQKLSDRLVLPANLGMSVGDVYLEIVAQSAEPGATMSIQSIHQVVSTVPEPKSAELLMGVVAMALLVTAFRKYFRRMWHRGHDHCLL